MIRKEKKIKEDLSSPVESFAITVLKDSEAVLMKRISRMREGKPRTAAQHKLADLRKAVVKLMNKQND
jgi:hypothetical protein